MMWDLYNNQLEKTEKVIHDGDLDNIPDGFYHLTVNIWIINSNNEVLMLKKSLNYDLIYPGYWTSINGNVISGDDPYCAVKKIILSKIGIKITDTDEIIKLGTDFRNPHHYIYETFIIYKDINIKSIFMDDTHYSRAKWIGIIELRNMMNNGEIEFPIIERIEKYILPLLISKK